MASPGEAVGGGESEAAHAAERNRGVRMAGKYKYYCPPHEPQMFGRFTVTS